MKSITSKVVTLTTGLLMLGASGCTDPTVNPVSTIGEANVFNDIGSYRSFLAKIYAGLALTGQQGPAGDRDIFSITDEGFSDYMRLYWEVQELPTDEAAIAWGDQGLPELNTMSWGSNNRFIAGMFSRIYFQISLADDYLDQTTDAKLAERRLPGPLQAQVHTYRAEARFLRALSYWHGLDLIGPIPLVLHVSTTPPQAATRQEVYDFIVSELTDIIADLPAAAGSSTYARATKEAALMLLAHVYMQAEVYTGTPHYDLALAALQQVIAGPFSLDPSYAHLFQADNNTSPEIIFPIAYDGLHTQGYGGMTFLQHASCGNQMDPNTYGIDGCWWGIRLRPETYNRFTAGDLRAASFFTTGQTVAMNSLSDFAQGIAAPKFSNKTSTGANGSNPAFADSDFPVFRLADAYLLYAEAVVRLNDAADRPTALGYVNAIRERAFGNTTQDITDPELTLALILDERNRELYWECYRRQDLIRFGLFSGGTYLWTWKGGVLAGQATDSHLDVYPVPATQIAANPNLQQNPGY
jgi:hypothetical protein